MFLKQIFRVQTNLYFHRSMKLIVFILNDFILSVFILNGFILSVFILNGFILSVFILNGFILAVFILNGFILSVFILNGFISSVFFFILNYFNLFFNIEVWSYSSLFQFSLPIIAFLSIFNPLRPSVTLKGLQAKISTLK